MFTDGVTVGKGARATPPSPLPLSCCYWKEPTLWEPQFRGVHSPACADGEYFCASRVGRQCAAAVLFWAWLRWNGPAVSDKGAIQKPQPSEPGRCQEACHPGIPPADFGGLLIPCWALRVLILIRTSELPVTAVASEQLRHRKVKQRPHGPRGASDPCAGRSALATRLLSTQAQKPESAEVDLMPEAGSGALLSSKGKPALPWMDQAQCPLRVAARLFGSTCLLSLPSAERPTFDSLS